MTLIVLMSNICNVFQCIVIVRRVRWRVAPGASAIEAGADTADLEKQYCMSYDGCFIALSN